MDNESLRAVFNSIAGDGAKTIPTKDLKAALVEAYGFHGGHQLESFASSVVMLTSVEAMDTNADEQISWEEFRAAVRQAETDALMGQFFSEKTLQLLGVDSYDDKALKAAFDAIDRNKSGSLEAWEITDLLLRGNPILYNTPEFKEMVESVMARLDTDHNQAISWEEFKSVFKVYQLSVLQERLESLPA